MTPQQEVPKFVFNKGRTIGEHQEEVKLDKVEAAQDPIGMVYKDDVG